jgi:hypothetical protein
MPDIKPGMINQKAFQIFITNIPTSMTIKFDGWVTNFNDTFSSSWNSVPVYGRMDDLHTFQRTGRKITLAFDVVSANHLEAKKNVRKLNRLAQFLYPLYSAPHGDLSITANSQALQAPPLLKMKWNGLISNAFEGGALVGFLQGFNYTPDLSAGQFFVPGAGTGKPYIAYQTHKVSLSYTVLHTHLTGWTQQTAGSTKYIFGGDVARDIGSTFPHAISDAVVLPAEGATPDETPPDPAGPNPAPNGNPDEEEQLMVDEWGVNACADVSDEVCLARFRKRGRLLTPESEKIDNAILKGDGSWRTRKEYFEQKAYNLQNKQL